MKIFGIATLLAVCLTMGCGASRRSSCPPGYTYVPKEQLEPMFRDPVALAFVSASFSWKRAEDCGQQELTATFRELAEKLNKIRIDLKQQIFDDEGYMDTVGQVVEANRRLDNACPRPAHASR